MTAARKGREIVAIQSGGSTTLRDWLETNRREFDDAMKTAGAVLFRGFPMTSVGAFQRVSHLLCGELFTDNAEHTPVSADGAVQTPVAYSAERMLLWHNENSFNDEWPLRIAFCSMAPAASGGETPVVDSGLIYREIDEGVRAQFAEKGIAYIRYFGSGVGLDWRKVFHSEDRAAVEAYCRTHQILDEWREQELVRTVSLRPAVVAHPESGELSWFNQAQHWHPSCLDPDVREMLERSDGAESLPRNCTFGDGTPIPDEYMHHVLEVYRQHQIVFPWQRGDVLVLDNVLWAHGRNPYQGRRTMLVALGTATRYANGHAAAEYTTWV